MANLALPIYRRIVAEQVPESETVVSAITASENPKRGSAPNLGTNL
jgi:hypothetical protein